GALFLGCFLLGLGVWDKVLFLWILGGLIVGVSCVFPRELWRRLTFRNTARGRGLLPGRPSAADLQRRFGVRNVPFRRGLRLGGAWAKGRAAPLCLGWPGPFYRADEPAVG